MYHNQNQLAFLTNMEDSMFSAKNLILFTKYKLNSNFVNKGDKKGKEIIEKKREREKEKEAKKIYPGIFETNQKDSLFWCFYVLMNGIEQYDLLGNQHFVEEKKLKFKFIQEVREKKEMLKTYKIRPLSEVEDDLANKPQISEKTFIALCIMYHIDVMIIYKRQYYEIVFSDTKQIRSIIYKTEQPLKYTLDLKSSLDKNEKYQENYFKLPNLNFKMKTMTSYKLDELKEIAIRLGIPIESSSSLGDKKKQGKKEIYELIVSTF